MEAKTLRHLKSGASLLAGTLFVLLLTFVVRPVQTDSAHVRGVLNAKGRHGAEGGGISARQCRTRLEYCEPNRPGRATRSG